MHSNADAEDFLSAPSTRVVELENSGYCGFHLTRSKWDPYPWITKVDPGSPAVSAGLRPGECVLEINGEDIVGKRISEVAERVKSGPGQVSLLVWNCGTHPQCTPESLCCGPLPQNLQKLTACVSSILSALECPVCLETIQPPARVCDNGHLICLRCRAKSEKCPVCRIRLSRGRSLLAEHVYDTVTDIFELREEPGQGRTAKIQKLFKLTYKNKSIPDVKITQSPKNKFLARITGKSSSADNLSNETKYNPNLLKVPLEQDFSNNLKMKSLSSNEIFKLSSPGISRAGSAYHINRLPNKSQVENKQLRHSISCHGSLESIEKRIKNDNISECKELYQCPYTPDCAKYFKGTEMLAHFQVSHEGPLVQYFQKKFKLSFANIVVQENPCYVIHFDEKIFFLRILELPNKISTKLLMWMWHLGNCKESSQFHLQIKIYNSEGTVVLGVTNPIYSLKSATWSYLLENKRGVYFNSINVDEILEVEIVYSNSV